MFSGRVPTAPARTPLLPGFTLAGAKDAGNPTFPTSTIPESIVKVGSTYWCVYQTWVSPGQNNTIGLASSSDRDGPWTAYGSNPIYETTDVPWFPAGADGIYAPFLMEHEGTFYLFYSVADLETLADGHIGYATASAVTGPYTDHGSAILSPVAASWESLRVAEPAVLVHDGLWVMAYMAETVDESPGHSEKIGVATATSAAGPWTRAPNNPLVDHGADTAWDDDLIADPDLQFVNGYWWMLYSGGGSSLGGGTTRKWHLGLAYATDPLGPWTKHTSNPVLSAGSSGFDEGAAWRGGLWIEDGEVSGVYGGATIDLSATQGGNFRLEPT